MNFRIGEVRMKSTGKQLYEHEFVDFVGLELLKIVFSWPNFEPKMDKNWLG